MTDTGANPGRLITFEGGDGTGKSTQIQALATRLRDRGRAVCVTREPGGTAVGEALRRVLMTEFEPPMPAMTELLLMFAARSAHLEQVIEPGLAAGQVVLCDRFTDASYAYQGRGRGLGDDAVAALERLVQGERRPDGVVVLDMPPRAGLARVRQRGRGNRFDDEALRFHDLVRETYRERAAAEPGRYALIDAGRPHEIVAADVAAAVDRWL